MVPDDEQVVARRIMLHTPTEEIAQDSGIAGVGLAEILECILGKLRALAQVEALGRSARAGAVELGNHVDGSAGADFFHLAQIGSTGTIEIVVASEIDHDRPVGARARILALLALRRGSHVCHVRSCFSWIGSQDLFERTRPQVETALLQKESGPEEPL